MEPWSVQCTPSGERAPAKLEMPGAQWPPGSSFEGPDLQMVGSMQPEKRLREHKQCEQHEQHSTSSTLTAVVVPEMEDAGFRGDPVEVAEVVRRLWEPQQRLGAGDEEQHLEPHRVAAPKFPFFDLLPLSSFPFPPFQLLE